MPSNRRRFVGLSASLVAGVAGCLGGTPGDDTESPSDVPSDTDGKKNGSPEGTATDPPSDAERTVGDITVAVTDIVARKAVTYTSSMGSGGVVAREGRQFVVASVHTDADLELEAFSLRAADGDWTASVPGESGGINRAVAGHEGGPVGRPLGGDGPQFAAFELPSPFASTEPRIHFERDGESAEWPLPKAAVSTLTSEAPRFELDSLEAPDSVRQGDQMEVSLTVTNTSDVDGRFLAAVYWPTELIADDDESHIVETDVTAGETVTQSLTITTDYTTNEDGPIELWVDGHVVASTDIRVEDASTDY